MYTTVLKEKEVEVINSNYSYSESDGLIINWGLQTVDPHYPCLSISINEIIGEMYDGDAENAKAEEINIDDYELSIIYDKQNDSTSFEIFPKYAIIDVDNKTIQIEF